MYIVIDAAKLPIFAKRCSEAMEKGAKPIGGMTTADTAPRGMGFPSIHYYQAFDAPDDFKLDSKKE